MKALQQRLKDVYRDLRDRHLLLPAIALLVALVAVPMLLREEQKSPKTPTPAPISGEASEVSAAVLADDAVDVRNYKKRLADLKKTNPFEPQFNPSEDGGSGGGGETPSSESGSTGTSTGVGGTDSAPAGPAPSPTAPDSQGVPPDDQIDVEVDEGGGNGNNNNGGGGQPTDDDVEVVSELVTRRVDLMMGLQGDPKLHENVKPMTILPDEQSPVVAFLGTDEAGKRAAFVVAKDATVVAGNGACVPAPENCLYITLEKNETATLDFGVDGQTYDLRLLEIRDVELKAEK